MERAIRLVAIDIDGTLVGSSGQLSMCVKRAVQSAVVRGCEVVLCTGRSRYTTRAFMDELQLCGPVILFSGAVVLHWGTGEVWHRAVLPRDMVAQIVRVIRSYGMGAVLLADGIESDCVVADRVLPPALRYTHRNIERLNWVDDLTECIPFEPATIGAVGSEDTVRGAVDELKQRFGSRLVVSASFSIAYDGWVIEVHHHDAGKGRALKLVADRLGIPREQVMAIGDHFNDIEMFEVAGLAIAMANSPYEVQRAAHYIVPSADDDGVAEALERFAMGNEKSCDCFDA
ncbi:MAG TPA: HAD family phosphatase [Armatimonadetes bacterium]|nr:HAD family phosphatase [Armatimonadota bacterium]